VVILAIAVFLLWRVHELLLVAFIAVLLSVYLGGFTDRLVRHTRMPRGAGLTISLLVTLAAVAGLMVLLAPAVMQQTDDLIQAVPRYLGALDRWVVNLAASSDVFRNAAPEAGFVSDALSDAGEFIRRSFFAYAAGTGLIIIDGIAVIAMAFYLSIQPHTYLDGIIAVVPPRHRTLAREILIDIGATLRHWVGAQLLAMVVLAVATAFGLVLLGVPYWLAFSIFAGVAVMVPFFGTITSTLLPALLVLPERGAFAFFAVAMVGVVVHLLEANVVHPLIMQHRVALPPALTILSVLVMGSLAGLLGMVVAVPLLATIVVLVRHIVIYKAYGERALLQHAVLKPARTSAAALPAVTAP